MPVLLLFAFLSGLVTIAAPCIWPLLPVVLSTSALGGRRRPLGVTLGILISFGVVTLSVSYLVHLLGFDASLLRTVAVVVLLTMGAVLLLPALGQRAEGLEVIAEGLARASETGVHYWTAELYRLRGELTRTDEIAESSFVQALATARRQGAKSLELRAAMSLSRRREAQGRRSDARALLDETHGWFTEGFETADLKEAGALLADPSTRRGYFSPR